MDDWVEEELQAMPQTDTVFDQPQLVIDAHKWQQQGYFIHDVCSPRSPDCHHAGIPIPPTRLLIHDVKGYRLVDEKTRV